MCAVEEGGSASARAGPYVATMLNISENSRIFLASRLDWSRQPACFLSARPSVRIRQVTAVSISIICANDCFPAALYGTFVEPKCMNSATGSGPENP